MQLRRRNVREKHKRRRFLRKMQLRRHLRRRCMTEWLWRWSLCCCMKEQLHVSPVPLVSWLYDGFVAHIHLILCTRLDTQGRSGAFRTQQIWTDRTCHSHSCRRRWCLLHLWMEAGGIRNHLWCSRQPESDKQTWNECQSLWCSCASISHPWRNNYLQKETMDIHRNSSLKNAKSDINYPANRECSQTWNEGE